MPGVSPDRAALIRATFRADGAHCAAPGRGINTNGKPRLTAPG